MPGLTLRSEQIQRLCGLDPVICEKALATLVETGFLAIRPDGAYGRFPNPDISRARPAQASFEPSMHATFRGRAPARVS